MLKVGIIGLGGVSEAHLGAYQEVSGIEVVAAAEPRQERLDEMSALHGFRGYSDYCAMLETESLDIACVLVPASLHRQVVQTCAEAGVHVFCEKPLANSLKEALDMQKAVDKAVKDITAKQRVAVEEGDTPAFDKLEEEKTSLLQEELAVPDVSNDDVMQGELDETR